ncbi:MAG: hypothetical protein HY257_00870 [Chloroflexi bacterium]|nr:hypothetical protein [Chloroflexota bacterium]
MNAKELVLRIVSLNDVVLHEQIENKRVEKLIERLKQDRLLKNPPIVSEFQDKYIVLDGASRTTALKQMNCRDVVVQIVDYTAPGIVLETWNHMLLDAPVNKFFDAVRAMSGVRVEPVTMEQATDALAQRKSIATIMLGNGKVYSLCAQDDRLPEHARILNAVVAAYEGRGEMYRVAHTDVERLIAEHGRLSALIVFPRYRPDEIRQLALNGSKLPMGVTRHIIPGRALRINLPLAILESAQSLEEKNAWLDDWLTTKIRERHARFYQEPVFLFDE